MLPVAIEASFAAGDPIQSNSIADLNGHDIRADCYYFAGAFMAENTRQIGVMLTGNDMLVTVTYT